jgi:hypothetical protein
MELGPTDLPLVTLIGTDVLSRYVACCDMLIAAKPSWRQSEGTGSPADVWQEAHDTAVAALHDLKEGDVARIGAAILELRLAAEPGWPT